MPTLLTASIMQEGDGYGSQRPEVDVASQSTTAEGVLANLKEALEHYFEDAHAFGVSGHDQTTAG